MELSYYLLVLHCLLFGILHSNAAKKSSVWRVRSVRESSQNNLHGIIEKGYYVEVMIGTPPQPLNILIDTGSSNFAVASKEDPFISKYYVRAKSSTAKDMNLPDIDIKYTEGFWKGHLITDVVSIPSTGLTKNASVSIVEITQSEKFFIEGSGWQGILGMGYTELVRPDNPAVKCFMQTFVETTGIDDIFSLKLCMADVRKLSDEVSGTFIIGDYDRSTGPYYWTRIVHQWYYEVLILGLKVGNVTVNLKCEEFNNDKTIVDSGTTNLHLPQKIFQSVVQIMKTNLMSLLPDYEVHDTFWNGDTKLCWNATVDPYRLFPTLTIYLPSTEGNHTIELSVHPEHYILFLNDHDEESLNAVKACYKFGISSSTTGSVLGAVVMEEYNVVFDRMNKRVGFAKSDCSTTSNLQYQMGCPNSTSCVYKKNTSFTPMQIASYALLGLLLLCLVPVCILSYAWCCKKKKSTINDTDQLLDNPLSST